MKNVLTRLTPAVLFIEDTLHRLLGPSHGSYEAVNTKRWDAILLTNTARWSNYASFPKKRYEGEASIAL